jgi:hypothetical protein
MCMKDMLAVKKWLRLGVSGSEDARAVRSEMAVKGHNERKAYERLW